MLAFPNAFVVLAACAAVLPGRPASGQAGAAEGLGDVTFENSCPAPARERIDRAMAYLHHMTYTRARTDFEQIAAQHPTCGIAHWGVAMTLFQPLWPTRPTEADLERGWQEVGKAKAAGTGTRREQMVIATAAAFFDPAAGDYWARIGAWANATQALYEAFPRDIETRALFALSQLATAPATGDQSHHGRAASVLAGIIAERPTHPGANHYMIHANDAAGREHESLDVVRRYGEIAPRNPHALHMPTHIFVRLGAWPEVIDWNDRAAAAALEDRAGDRGQWVWDEFPHALEYLVYAHLQMGNDAAALRAMTRLQRTADLQPSFKTAFHLSSIPARYALERHDWMLATMLDPRPGPELDWDRFPWPEAVTWYAQGIGAVHSGDVAKASASSARLLELQKSSERLGETLFARQTEIQKLGLDAWIASANGDSASAVRLMERAATLESSTPKPPVTPAPILPASEQLGDLLLELGRANAALRAYETSLRSDPGRFNSLVGAARAARRAGDASRAAQYYRELRETAAPASTRPELAEARDFLDGRQQARHRWLFFAPSFSSSATVSRYGEMR